MPQNNLLKLISESGTMYVFDALTNNFFIIEHIEDFETLAISDIGHSIDVRENSLDLLNITKEVTSNAQTLILEITEKCNLRCTYCVFDKDSSIERNHGSKTISLENVFTAVDNFYARTNKNGGHIVFYGGEPLLEFKKIQEIVNYSNAISNSNLKFSITTNGTLLTKEKFDFLISNNFLITVSLDGPRDVHDKHRVNSEGIGSFDQIVCNLNMLKHFNNVFFENNILINCVISDIDDIDHVNLFFENKEYPYNSLRFTSVFKHNISSKNIELYGISLKSATRKANNISKPVENYFIDTILKKIEFRETDNNSNKGKKICVPFADRTYIRSDGAIQFCERIENYAKLQPNTNNLDSVSQTIHNKMKQFIENDCNKCFAYNFCELCPASFINNDDLDKKISDIKCCQFRGIVKQALLIYINHQELEMK